MVQAVLVRGLASCMPWDRGHPARIVVAGDVPIAVAHNCKITTLKIERLMFDFQGV